ncbi:hypothetical protein D3C80_1269450 [compost metagenome]
MIQIFDIGIHVRSLIVINQLNILQGVFFQRQFKLGRSLIFYRFFVGRNHDIVVGFSFRIHTYIELCVGNVDFVNFDFISTNYIP